HGHMGTASGSLTKLPLRRTHGVVRGHSVTPKYDGAPSMSSMKEVRKLLESRALLPLWPDVGNILGLSRNATYAAAQRGYIRTIELCSLNSVTRYWLTYKLELGEPSKGDRLPHTTVM